MKKKITLNKIKIAQLIENPLRVYGGTLQVPTKDNGFTCPGDPDDTKSPIGTAINCDPPTLNDDCAIGDIPS